MVIKDLKLHQFFNKLDVDMVYILNCFPNMLICLWKGLLSEVFKTPNLNIKVRNGIFDSFGLEIDLMNDHGDLYLLMV